MLSFENSCTPFQYVVFSLQNIPGVTKNIRYVRIQTKKNKGIPRKLWSTALNYLFQNGKFFLVNEEYSETEICSTSEEDKTKIKRHPPNKRVIC